MPTYVYHCRACDKTFEADQRITEAPLTDCDCGATGSLKRIIQPIAVMFKGSGFHINDYAPKAAESKGGAESKDGAESKGESESKPTTASTEAKSETTAKPEPTKTESAAQVASTTASES